MKEVKRGKFKPNNNKFSKSPSMPKTRKDVRKARRKIKKLMKREHMSKTKNKKNFKRVPGQFVRAPTPETTAHLSDEDFVYENPTKPKKTVKFVDIVQEERKEEKKEQQRLVRDIASKRKELLLMANEEEELLIKKLEKQLGMKKMKSKNITKSFAGDGLDYLLEICDRSTLEQSAAAEKYLAEIEDGSDFEEDIAIASGQKTRISKKRKDINLPKEIGKDTDDSGSDMHSDEVGFYGGSDGISDEENIENDISRHEDYNESDCEENYDESESLLDSDDELSEDEMKEPDLAQIYSRASSSKRKNIADDSLLPKQKIKRTLKEERRKESERISDINRTSDKYPDSGSEVNPDDGSESENQTAQKNGIWEDIYGRKRDGGGNILKDDVSKYIPPHFRKQANVPDSEEVVLLKRQMKSILNKIAGSNMHWACSQIEHLYNSNSRNSVNNALCDLWSEAIIQKTLSSARMVAEHAMLIAVLQANVGTEIGAHFLQTLVKKFDLFMIKGQNLEDKMLENLICGLSYLYSFKIFHASLFFEILQKLIEEITEKNIECVLIALRNVGGILRKDEPTMLKTFIHNIQSKTTQLSELVASGTRVKFLMDVLLAIKNNNLSKIPNYDPSYLDELKKAMKGIVRRGNYVTPLNIKMDDLLKADERGKWWVVGSAWNGTLNEMSRNANDISKPIEKNVKNKKLLELARQQRMNTDSRRAIFCIIMSAEDFIDAFEKLLHLGLKNQQEKDIVHVLIACCLQEKKYNPYYSVLAQKFCDYDRKFQLSIQFAVWDKLKEISDFSTNQLVNLGQFLTHLFLQKSLPLSVLKIIHFAELNKPTLRLMRQTLLAILLNDREETCLEVFQRIAVSAKLHMFRESLRLFIRHFLLKNLTSQENTVDLDKKNLLEQRASQVDKILSKSDTKIRF